MKKTKKLILFGDSDFGEVAYEYFQKDSPYQVVAFTVSQKFLKGKTKFGLPVLPFETIEHDFPPQDHEMHIALVYNQMNRIRAQYYNEAKAKGYALANYISQKSFIWENVTFGDNVFIFEDNTLQPFVSIGSDTVLWSGNHVGHHSKIGHHCFIASQVVISGKCTIKDYCFIGVNASIANDVTIEKDNIIGAGALIVKGTQPGQLYKGLAAKPDPISIYEKFGIKEA